MNDFIERQAAIDAIYAEFEYVYCYNCDHEGNEEWCEDCHRKYMKWSASRDTIERVLNDLPSAQPEPQWIPCSETEDLPNHKVLCCDRYGEELIGWLSYKDDQWLCESEGEMMYDPIAWREKPEPWRGEEHETD